MGTGLIILGIIIFLLGFLTPLNDLYTLPISIVFIVFGINIVMRKRKLLK